MAVANLKVNVLETLKGGIGAAEPGGSEQIFLTPYLALACSLLYMMASDGELEAEESSQFQAVVGGDEAVLSYALRYVQAVPVEQFFQSAVELLSTKDKWCILTNVCDALLSDGHADAAELELFGQMTEAFGISESQFQPFFKILALKNDKSVLGRYTGVKEERQPMTPHFALAIALLYMLTADGSIGAQEVGQLESVIGEFDGLQNIALKYVRSVKLKQFLNEASALLRPDQKIYILMNVCDSMLSDGEVAHLEDKLFLSMLTSFGFTEKTFGRYLQVIETKNFKPFDTSEFKNRVIHDRVLSEDEKEGVAFKNDLAAAHGVSASHSLLDAANQGVWVGAADEGVMSQFIARTMQDNLQNVTNDFGTQSNVIKVGLNATDGFNVQKIEDEALGGLNRQQLEGGTPADNLQKIEASDLSLHREQVDSENLAANRQLVHADKTGRNLQSIPETEGDVHRETLNIEVRVENIHELVETVHHRLDRFEVDHFSFLQIGRRRKFSDTFELIEDEPSDINRQLVDESFARMGLGQTFASAEQQDSLQIAAKTEDPSSLLTASEPIHAAAEETVVEFTTTVNAEVGATLNPRSDSWWVPVGLASWNTRGQGFGYVQLFVAVFTIVFAAPIGTRAALRPGSIAGPLILAPSTALELRAHRKVLESELSAAESVRR